jgi:hypothetical protein
VLHQLRLTEAGFWRLQTEQLGADVVAHMAFAAQQHDRLAVAVRDGMKLRVQTAFGAPGTLGIALKEKRSGESFSLAAPF